MGLALRALWFPQREDRLLLRFGQSLIVGVIQSNADSGVSGGVRNGQRKGCFRERRSHQVKPSRTKSNQKFGAGQKLAR